MVIYNLEIDVRNFLWCGNTQFLAGVLRDGNELVVFDNLRIPSKSTITRCRLRNLQSYLLKISSIVYDLDDDFLISLACSLREFLESIGNENCSFGCTPVVRCKEDFFFGSDDEIRLLTVSRIAIGFDLIIRELHTICLHMSQTTPIPDNGITPVDPIRHGETTPFSGSCSSVRSAS